MSTIIKSIHILLEDPDFAIIDKPAGLLVHPVRNHARACAPEGPTGRAVSNGVHKTLSKIKEEPTLADWVAKTYPETKSVGDDPKIRPGIVHRLDKETSGVLLIARTQEFFEYFKKLLQAKKVQKTYLALVHGEIKNPQTINAPIGLISGKIKRSTRAKKMKMIKEALTEIEPVQKLHYKKLFPERAKRVEGLQLADEIFTLLKVFPKTGRTHQIRVHLASIGHPVAGDKLYGSKKLESFGLTRHFLHASSLEFSTSDGRRIRVESELPKDLQKIIENCNP